MSTAARKARKRNGLPFERAQKTPTPVVNRASSWRYGATKTTAGKLRPTRLGVLCGIRDLGWDLPKAYLNKGRLTRKASA